MEIPVGDLRGADGDVLRELGVQRLSGALGRRPALRFDTRNLAQRVDTGVRPPGDREFAPAGKDPVQRVAHGSLDGA